MFLKMEEQGPKHRVFQRQTRDLVVIISVERQRVGSSSTYSQYCQVTRMYCWCLWCLS